ncbi:MAG: PEP/pyruvate-binding domain-containing protein [Ignavibacteriaceae bacterium]
MMDYTKEIKRNPEARWVEHGYGNRFQGFQNLMRLRVVNILLVSSLYDLYLFEEDGRLYELIRHEYQGLNLSHSPELTRVSSGQDAINRVKEEGRFDLIITTLHIEDMTPLGFAKLIKEAGLKIPIILLGHDNRELKALLQNPESSVFDKVFIWTGDFRIIIGIIKYIEDKLNVEHDSKIVGVQNVIFVEDSERYYSALLPIIYTEMLKQSQRLISEGINLSHKFLRMRARPKILLCSSYEEAWEYFEKYKELILGIISDIAFPRNGKLDDSAGLKLAKSVKDEISDIPILLTSNNADLETDANKAGNAFLLKDSPTLILELQHFMNRHFGFGDFVFRTPDGSEVDRAGNLRNLEEKLKTVPPDCIKFHASRNHFSNWLKARTEFWLAHQLRPRKVSDYPSVEGLRDYLVSALHNYRLMRQRGIIADFNKETFDPESSFARIGGGSLGGKARGLGFANTLISNYQIRDQFEDVQISVPPAIVLGANVFDDFLEMNKLRRFALESDDDEEITKRFLDASKFPEEILGELAAFLDLINTPLAVRSSSLLEDSQYHPFAGVYQTYMIPNNNSNPLIRLNDLLTTIKRVYASTFYQGAKNYIKITAYRLEEEKMAVIIQKMVGNIHENKFYPEFSGVAKSFNFYPLPPQKPTDGTVSVALGLGKMVVEGGNTVRFCPKYPDDLIQFYSVQESLNNSQREFYALQLDEKTDFGIVTYDKLVKNFGLEIAEADGTLNYVGSTYIPDNDAIYDGLSREGIRIVTFGPILRNKMFPLSNILELLLEMGNWGMGTAIEMEFAVKMSTVPGRKKEFGLLQIRPLVVSHDFEDLKIEQVKKEKLICQSSRVLGNGIINDVYDAIVVDYHLFERAKSREVAAEVASFNTQLIKEKKPYLLVGVGRWGSLDQWLGIPVNWAQIAGAKVIVETSFKDLAVEPSQGSHFFQNITSFMIGYFTVSSLKGDDFVDWDWLLKQETVESKTFTKHIRFKHPVIIKMNGHENKGIIIKPE